MRLLALIPVRLFTQEHSDLACTRMKVREIKLYEWVTLETLFSIVLPPDFDLYAYLQTDKLFGVLFMYSGKSFEFDGEIIISEREINVLIHPDKVLSLGKREARKTIKHEYKRKRIPAGRVIH